MMKKRFARTFVGIVGLALIVSVLGASPALAQSTPSSPAAAPKAMNESARERRKALEEEAAQRQRRREAADQRILEAVQARDRLRADCRGQAKEQDLHLLKRFRFIRQCMASGSPR
jgi:hypothetical protein